MTGQVMLKDLTLAVLFGGLSGEREVSLSSAKTLLEALREGGYAPRAIDTGEARWWTALEGVDLAFNIQHGAGGEDGATRGFLDTLGIACTGSGVLGSALAMDKLRAKQIWRAAGLPTADFAVLDEQTDLAALLADWGAAFIKPAREGSSLGMTRVDSVAGMQAARALALRHDSVVLAERLINGPEYTVAVLGSQTLPAIRVEAAGPFYDYEAKYRANSTRYHIPCGLSADDERELSELCLRAFALLDCSIWGRVDVMRDPLLGFQLLEVNTVPGMTDHSLVPMAARAAGMSILQLLENIMLQSFAAWQTRTGGHVDGN